MSLETRVASIRDIVDVSVDAVSNQINEKKIRLRVDIDEIFKERFVQVDPDILAHNVLANILTNAIKFSPEGGEVCLKAIYSDGFACIKIIDRGVGIPKELQKVIFDASTPTSRKGTNGEAGTGFGMPIAQNCIKKMNGNLHLSSISVDDDPENHGSVFTGPSVGNSNLKPPFSAFFGITL